MKTTLGFKIKRISKDQLAKTKVIPLCYSCNIPSSGGWGGDKYWVSEGSCDGFIRGVHEEKYVIQCSGYKEQTFVIPITLKERLQTWVDDYCYASLEGQRNITQQSDNWFAMELEILAGIIDTLQNRQALNDLIHRGERLLHKTSGNDVNEVIENLFGELKDKELKSTTKCKHIERVTITKTCDECGCELKYCKECHAYHHTDSFKEEHLEMKP